jgi:RNA polymerase sigma-70 factor (ECF subfamily)
LDDDRANQVDELIRRAQQHDERAMAELLTSHTQRLLESVRAELGDRLRTRLESQDVMQQVYLDALNNIDKFVSQGHDSFFRWLHRIALNRICDADRKAFKTTKRAGELRVGDMAPADASVLNLLDHLPVSMSGPVTTADRGDRVKLLQQAIEQLSPDHRQVLELRYLKQLSVEETAERMERTDRAIRSMSVRALIRLRELLGNAL